MSPPLQLSFEQDDADGIAVDYFNHAIVRGNARHVLLRLDDDPPPGFLLHGRIAGLDEDLFAVLAQAAPAAANVAAPGPPLEYGEIAKHGIHRRSSLSEREMQRERHQRGGGDRERCGGAWYLVLPPPSAVPAFLA
jgi:hypothetical protein